MTKQARKQDTRGKIMMGGLVIKAGLGYLHEEQKDVLLGILVDAREKLAGESQEVSVEHFKALGKQAFE